MLRAMCQGDSFAIPRLGKPQEVEQITPEALYRHYKTLLRTSPVEIFYVGSAKPQALIQALAPLVENLKTEPMALPEQQLFTPAVARQECFEAMDIAQAKLSMGFYCGISYSDPDYAAAQVFNAIYGAGMTSKLFMNVREKLSLCYYANSSYYGAKGIMTVSSGIDEENYESATAEILAQLDACRAGEVSQAELDAAKTAIISSLRTISDSPSALEGFYATAPIGGIPFSIREYMDAIQAVTVSDVQQVANKMKHHTTYCLKGVAK